MNVNAYLRNESRPKRSPIVPIHQITRCPFFTCKTSIAILPSLLFLYALLHPWPSANSICRNFRRPLVLVSPQELGHFRFSEDSRHITRKTCHPIHWGMGAHPTGALYSLANIHCHPNHLGMPAKDVQKQRLKTFFDANKTPRSTADL